MSSEDRKYGEVPEAASDEKAAKAENSEQGKKQFRLRRWTSLSYRSRVTISFALIAAMTICISICVLSFVWNKHFQTYTEENMQSLAMQTARSVETIYDNKESLYCSEIRSVMHYADSLNEGVGIALIDNKTGEAVYDSSKEQVKEYQQSMEKNLGSAGALSDVEKIIGEVIGETSNTSSKGVSSSSSGGFTNGISTSGSSSGGSSTNGSSSGESSSGESSSAESNKQPITHFCSAAVTDGGKAVGSVRVWVYGSDVLLRQADEEFRDNSYEAVAVAAVAAIILALIIGYFFARSLVAPVNTMTKTARRIKEGDLSARTNIRGEDELSRLCQTFDEMASAVEKDRELERRLTTDVAHELRTPLMAIQSTVEAMVDGVFEPNAERLETVSTEVQRLGKLVGGILKLSRLENRASNMKKEKVNVSELAQGIVSTHEAFVTDSLLTLKSDIEPEVYICGDDDMLRQALVNLISNAVRYTPEGGSITVTVKQGDITALMSVEDTGIGLSPEEKKMVFSRFWRADAGRARESGGLGIGLSVVKEIVDRHGGWVAVDGERGKGAKFTIRIPLYSENRKHQLGRVGSKTGSFHLK